MAKSVRTSPTSGRMSSTVSGDKPRGSGSLRAHSTVRSESYMNDPTLGTSVTRLGAYGKSPKTITDRVPAYGTATNVPATPRQNIRGGRGITALQNVLKQPTVNAPKATVVAKPVVAAPVKKPAAPVKKPPVQVISNVVREKPTPAQAAAPARKAVSARTGDTTGITTGKTTGTTARVGGVATKTSQSAYGRQMANAARRGNQPAGPMGGGGRSGSGGSSRPSGGGNLGGARGRIGEPGGSKR